MTTETGPIEETMLDGEPSNVAPIRRRRGGKTRISRTLSLTLGAAACLAMLLGTAFPTRSERLPAYAVCFSPRGDRVAALTDDKAKGLGNLWIWDVETGRQITSAAMSDRPLSMAFAPDGSAVATGGWNGTVELYDPAVGRRIRSFAGNSTPVRGLAFLPDGRSLAAGASDGSVILWDVESGRERMRFDRGRRFPVNGMAVSHDGRFLAAAGGLGAGAISLWNLETKKPLTPACLVGGGEPIAFAPDRSVLAARVASPAGSVSLIELDRDRVFWTISTAGARSLAFSPDGRLVVIGGNEAVVIHEAETGRSIAAIGDYRHRPDPLGDNFRILMANVGLADHPIRNIVWSIAFSPDGTRLATADQDGSVWLRSLPNQNTSHLPDRALLPLQNRPDWLRFVQISLTLATVALLALAIGVKRRSRRPSNG
ncbi:MAG: hypothetical protein NVSMB14_09930 [Isosphaeraceae bacterium]